MSQKPGAAASPSASTTRAAVSPVFPSAVMRPSLTAMSPSYRGRPVPSRIVTPRISVSTATTAPLPGSGALTGAASLATRRAGRRFDHLGAQAPQLIDQALVARVRLPGEGL